jgi:excisionase family DNA binding protein
MITTEKLTVSVNEAAEILGLSRNAAFSACKKGEIPTLRIGKRLLVPKSKLLALINGDKTPEAES